MLKILEPSKIISCSWKELGSDKITTKTIADYPTYKPGEIDDRLLVEEVWKILDDANVVCAHYGSAFDIKKLNARFVWYGLNAPSAYKTLDTKRIASKYFKFDSNSLNSLGQYFGVGVKVENGGFDLWVRCIEGDPEAWALMARYNEQDVLLLEQIYWKLRPFIEDHPNMAALSADNLNVPAGVCPTCLSGDVHKRGFSITKTGRKQRFQCGSCGSWSSGSFQRNKMQMLSNNTE